MSIIGKIGSWFGFPRKEAVQKTGMENQNGKDDEDGMTFDEVLNAVRAKRDYHYCLGCMTRYCIAVSEQNGGDLTYDTFLEELSGVGQTSGEELYQKAAIGSFGCFKDIHFDQLGALKKVLDQMPGYLNSDHRPLVSFVSGLRTKMKL